MSDHKTWKPTRDPLADCPEDLRPRSVDVAAPPVERETPEVQREGTREAWADERQFDEVSPAVAPPRTEKKYADGLAARDIPEPLTSNVLAALTQEVAMHNTFAVQAWLKAVLKRLDYLEKRSMTVPTPEDSTR